jgi:hypothetical protein
VTLSGHRDPVLFGPVPVHRLVGQLHYPWNPGRVLLDCEHVQLQAVDLCIRCVLYSCAMMCFLGHIDTRSDGLQYRIIGQLLYLSLITNTSIYFSACAVEAQHDL